MRIDVAARHLVHVVRRSARDGAKPAPWKTPGRLAVSNDGRLDLPGDAEKRRIDNDAYGNRD